MIDDEYNLTDTHELSKWKSRCASLTAEVVCLRKAIENYSEYEENPYDGPPFRSVREKYMWEANRIKAEREGEILNADQEHL